MNYRSSLSALTAMLALCGCASWDSKPPLVVDRVGPKAPERIIPKREGTLVVYSDWSVFKFGGDVGTRHHDDYKILRGDGSLYQKVHNAQYVSFEDPAAVALPAGEYVVDAFASRYGHVQIPVHIEPYHTTTVCLTGELDERLKKLSVTADALVTLPDGRIVGWRSEE